MLTQKQENRPPLVGPGLILIRMGIDDLKEDYGLTGPETIEGRSSIGAYSGFLGAFDLTSGSL